MTNLSCNRKDAPLIKETILIISEEADFEYDSTYEFSRQQQQESSTAPPHKGLKSLKRFTNLLKITI